MSVAGAGDVNGDGFADVIVGADLLGQPFVPPIANQGAGRQGGAFVFLGGPGGIVGSEPTQANARLVAWEAGQPAQINAHYGNDVAGAGDVNGDGFDDVIVGCPAWNQALSWPGVPGGDPPEEGAAFVFLGSAAGIVGTDPSSADTRIEGGQLEAFLGSAVASAGDVNADGFDDILIGAVGFPAGDPFLLAEEGAVFLYLGGPTGIQADGPEDARSTLQGSELAEWIGQSVSTAGDVDGDGFDDVILGARVYPGSLFNEGVAYVFRGGPAGLVGTTLGEAHARIVSHTSDALLGSAVALAGDIDGDQRPDLLVGVPGYSDGEALEGGAFLFSNFSVWSDEAGALAGVSGEPSLLGTGPLSAGSTNGVELSGAAAQSLSGFFVALSSSPVAFMGGLLQPFPFIGQPILAQTDAVGTVSFNFVMPIGVPPGTEIWVQAAIVDSAAIQGVALSNAIVGRTP